MRSIFDDLIPLSSLPFKSEEERANGRIIKPYPIKYDSFNTISDLEEYLRRKLIDDKTLNIKLIRVSNTVTMPINVWYDTFYTNVPVYKIIASEFSPSNRKSYVLDKKLLLALNPKDYILEELQIVINKLKKEFSSE